VKGIYYQAFISADDWCFIGKDSFSLQNMARKIQFAYLTKVKTLIDSPENLGVISALAVGNRNYLDKETKESYSDSGAMHVLAVSGLHVGLVWYMLNIIFGFLKSHRKTCLLYFFSTLSLLWLYVMVTGMSPSVVRAGVMLSILTASRLMKRGSVSSNPVFLSAFIILIFEPYLLLDVGFQLSYLAVFGILFFQPKIIALYSPKNRVARYFWELTAVSLAAQSGTLIPAIYYFNKFPTYFLLTNYIVLPLVTIILILIVFSFIFCFVQPVFNVVCKVIDFLTAMMNRSVALIDSLEGSSINWLYIDNWEVLFLSFGLLSLMLFLNKKKMIHFLLISLSVFLLCTYGGVRDVQRRSRGFVALHEVNDILALNISSASSHYIISRNISNEEKESIILACKPFWLYERVGLPQFIDLESKNNEYDDLIFHPMGDSENVYLYFQEIRIILIENIEAMNRYMVKVPIPSDIIILHVDKFDKLPEILDANNKGVIIASSELRGRLTPHSVIHKDYFDMREKGRYLSYFKILK
jgi:competence protein ComEC